VLVSTWLVTSEDLLSVCSWVTSDPFSILELLSALSLARMVDTAGSELVTSSASSAISLRFCRLTELLDEYIEVAVCKEQVADKAASERSAAVLALNVASWGENLSDTVEKCTVVRANMNKL